MSASELVKSRPPRASASVTTPSQYRPIAPPNPGSKSAREALRKESHSRIEKRRREKINETLTALRELIAEGETNSRQQHSPPPGPEREFKLELLERTVLFVRGLLDKTRRLEQELNDLRGPVARGDEVDAESEPPRKRKRLPPRLRLPILALIRTPRPRLLPPPTPRRDIAFPSAVPRRSMSIAALLSPSTAPALPSPHHQTTTMAPIESLEQVIQSAQSPISQDPTAHSNQLRNLAKKPGGNIILGSLLPVAPPTPVEGDAPPEPPASTQNDPLDLIDPAHSTLVALFILSARVLPESPAPPPLQHISNFCTNFNPEHARLAPERVTMLAQGIYTLAERNQAISDAIPLLMSLVRRYPPHVGYLTTIHPLLLAACVQARHFTTVIPILAEGITEIDTQISDVQYTDNLQYHYLGGCIYGALKRYKEAEDFFETTVTAPATAASAIQLEAYKKLGLIHYEILQYVSSAVNRIYKAQTAYMNFAKTYGSANLNDIPASDVEAFTRDNNMGLLKQAIARIPYWAVHKLTKVYVSLSLTEIGQAIKVSDPATVRTLIQTMITTGEIHATIPLWIVKFEDPPLQTINEAEGERLLGLARAQCLKLMELDKQIAKGKPYISAVGVAAIMLLGIRAVLPSGSVSRLGRAAGCGSHRKLVHDSNSLPSHYTLPSGDQIPSVALGAIPLLLNQDLVSDSQFVNSSGTWKAPRVRLAMQSRPRSKLDIDISMGLDLPERRGGRPSYQESGVDRKDLWLTSKLWNSFHKPEDIEPVLDETLRHLQTSYLDLYLIHWPVAFKEPGPNGEIRVDHELTENPLPTWKKLEELVAKGKIRNIGVSKYALEFYPNINTAINQVELNFFNPQPELVEWSKENKVLLESYSPLGSNDQVGESLKNPVVQDIAKDLKITPAQVIISWHVQRGTVVLPKSVTPSRVEENLHIFKLPEEQFEKLEKAAASHPPHRVVDPSKSWGVDVFEDEKQSRTAPCAWDLKREVTRLASESGCRGARAVKWTELQRELAKQSSVGVEASEFNEVVRALESEGAVRIAGERDKRTIQLVGGNA
ncbi:reductase [Rhizoctonia solani]|uniref:Reductase n=1 Tax=Rhizoctonia solani TaxID=456999 RepID=A0A8H7I887_9AGAM|nr:reductase [Rhizoctonia solani]